MKTVFEQSKKQERAKRKCELTTRTYQIRSDTLDEENRSVEAVIATENPVLVLDCCRWEVIEEILLMSGCRIPANGQVPMLDSHDRWTVQKQLGSTRELHTEKEQLIGRNYFSRSAAADHAWTLTKEGHLKDNSIGYRVINSVMITKGEEAKVEGRKFKASPTRDLRVTTEWEVSENSVCPIGADEGAKNRNEYIVSKGKDKTMEKFKEWLQKRGLKYDDLKEEQRTALLADFEAEEKREAQPADPPPAKKPDEPAKAPDDKETRQVTDPPPDTKAIAEEAIKAERQRVETIRALGGEDVPAEVIERCITEGKTIDETKGEVLAILREGRGKVTPAIHVQGGEVQRETLQDALLLRAGFEDAILEDKTDGEQRADKANHLRDISLVDMCRFALQMDGVEIPVGREDMMRAAFSTASLPMILSNVANKSMMKGYNSVPATWNKWCVPGSVSDFKTNTRLRLTDTGDLLEVPNSGEVKHGGATEEYEQFSIATYAKNFGITRQNIINDDLGAFTRTPQRMGVRAGQKPGDLVYAHLLANGNMQDGVALFHATHSNLNTGAGLSDANLRAAVAAFMKQTDKDGRPINIIPKFLVVPVDLMLLAMELLKSVTIVIAGSTDAVRGARNVLSELGMEVVADARMSNSSYTGYSTTTWFLMGNPGVTDTIEMAFLNGRRTPTIERFNPGADVMGIIFRIYFDCGCKSLDHRPMQKNTA